jgi:hypothetical protein
MKILSIGSAAVNQPEFKMVTVGRIRDSVCAFKYHKNYVETPRPFPPFTAMETGIGGFFHTFLEKHFKAIPAGVPLTGSHRLDVRELLRAFRMSFVWEGKPRPPYKLVLPGQTIEGLEAALEKVGNNFNEFLVKDLAGHRIIGVEGDIEIRTEDLCIYGKYDLITEDPSGVKILWDWKTGMMPQPKDYDEFRNTRLQLGIYAVWMKHRYKLENVPATAVFFKDGIQKISESFSNAVEKDVLEYLEGWRKRLNRLESFPPVLNDLCDWCGWNPLCPAYQEREGSSVRKDKRPIAVSAGLSSEAGGPGYRPVARRYQTELIAIVLGALLAGVLLYLHLNLGIWSR